MFSLVTFQKYRGSHSGGAPGIPSWFFFCTITKGRLRHLRHLCHLSDAPLRPVRRLALRQPDRRLVRARLLAPPDKPPPEALAAAATAGQLRDAQPVQVGARLLLRPPLPQGVVAPLRGRPRGNPDD